MTCTLAAVSGGPPDHTELRQHGRDVVRERDRPDVGAQTERSLHDAVREVSTTRVYAGPHAELREAEQRALAGRVSVGKCRPSMQLTVLGQLCGTEIVQAAAVAGKLGRVYDAGQRG